MSEVQALDALARPRIGIVVQRGDDAVDFAVVARTAVLAMLRRLPRARVEVLVPGDAAAPSALYAGRPPRVLAGGGKDRQRLDLLAVAGDVALSARAARGSAPVVRLSASAGDVALLGAAAMGGELLANRLGVMRLLGWLPAEGTAYVLGDGGVTLPAEAGADELIAAAAAAQEYRGGSAVLQAVVAGARGDVRNGEVAALAAAFDTAASAALDCWQGRGSPGAMPDDTALRRDAIENTALRVEIQRLEGELESASLHANHVATELRRVVDSRTWRYTEGAREVYRTARRRLRRP